jgi:sugar phosphate isomerase/epimerase
MPWAPLDSGAIDYRAVLRKIRSSGYAGAASIEFLATDRRPAAERLASDARFVRTALSL